jgi:hypothetical protein
MDTTVTEYLKSDMAYLADLFDAGITGAMSSWNGVDGRESARRFTPAVYAPTLVGATIGVLSAFLGEKGPRSTHRIVMSGLAGSALGFGGGAAWISRSLVRAAARGAVKKMDNVRDARWLEKHPIDYA